eukprot:m.53446 g.53446  ORF g.53446 m.53446 type:complete len:147 (-) comp11043_c0_seq1:598-1038(-)
MLTFIRPQHETVNAKHHKQKDKTRQDKHSKMQPSNAPFPNTGLQYFSSFPSACLWMFSNTLDKNLFSEMVLELVGFDTKLQMLLLVPTLRLIATSSHFQGRELLPRVTKHLVLSSNSSKTNRFSCVLTFEMLLVVTIQLPVTNLCA